MNPHAEAATLIALALLAILIELHSRTVYLLALAAALLAGAAAALASATAGTQFLAIGIGCLAGFPVAAWVRRHQERRPPLASADLGQTARVLQAEPHLRVYYRGTEWDAVCDAAAAPGDLLRIRGLRGNVLQLSRE